MSRTSAILSGLIGLAGAIILTALCLLAIIWKWMPVLVNNPLFVWVLFLFLLFFSVAEIPVMIFGIRRITASVNPKAKYMAFLVNTGYSFFGAVYAAPLILLTGRLGLGVGLAALSFVRFILAAIFLPRKHNDEKKEGAEAYLAFNHYEE